MFYSHESKYYLLLTHFRSLSRALLGLSRR
jgi:hypothetical protein